MAAAREAATEAAEAIAADAVSQATASATEAATETAAASRADAVAESTAAAGLAIATASDEIR